MTTSKLIRWSGAAAILSGLVNISASIFPPEVGSLREWGGTIGVLAAMFALIGFYAFQVEESGVWGFLGFLLAITSNVFFATPASYAASFVVGGAIYGLGLIMLAIGFWIAGKFPRWVPALWILTSLLGVLGSFLGEEVGSSIFFMLGGVAHGLGFIGGGYTLWKSD